MTELYKELINIVTRDLSVGLAYGIVVTLGVSEGRKLLFLFLIVHPAVLRLLLNNRLKEIPVDCVEALGRESE